MIFDNYICGLDIGASKIAAAVACIKKGHISNIFFESIPSKGIRNGLIVNSSELIAPISRLFKDLKLKSGINIKSIYTNISGEGILTKHSSAVIPLTEIGNKVVTLSDAKKVIEQARILAANLQEEIIHLLPISYSIDTNENIANPLGLYSHRLAADLFLVSARVSCLQNITRTINQAGFDVRDIFLSGIATSRVVFKESFPKETNFLCDIGGELSEILVFKNGRLENVRVIPLGGGSITQMLCEGLKVPFELAEEIKISYGIAGEYLQRDEAKEILVKKDSAYKSISRKLVSEIVNAGVKTVCQNIKEAVQDIVNEGEASTFLFCGRSVLLEGFLEKMETTLELPVKIARINHPALIPVINQSDLVSVQKRLTYLTCLGIICQVLDRQYPGYYSATSPHRNPIIRLYSKIQEIFQEYF